jgi:hypothetical protein
LFGPRRLKFSWNMSATNSLLSSSRCDRLLLGCAQLNLSRRSARHVSNVQSHAASLFRQSERSRGMPWPNFHAGFTGLLRLRSGWQHLCNHNKRSRYVFRSNCAKSPSFSPVPTKRVRIPSSSWIATTMPPLPLPSSLVTIRPVSSSALWNSRA